MATISPWMDNTRTHAPERRRQRNQVVLRRRFKWWTILFSLLNLIAISCVVLLTRNVSENWWLTGALLYIPQTPFLIPSICLLGCSAIWHMKSGLLNLAACPDTHSDLVFVGEMSYYEFS